MSQIVGGVFVLLQLIIGIGLIRYRNRARLWFNGYSVFNIAWVAINTLYLLIRLMLIDLEGMLLIMYIASIVAAPFGLIFPVLGMIFLNKPRVVASLS